MEVFISGSVFVETCNKTKSPTTNDFVNYSQPVQPFTSIEVNKTRMNYESAN